MGENRLETFSDGVIAIIITIMVLEMKVPHGAELNNLTPLIPIFLSYVLSFVFVGLYWNNHHHLLHAAKTITGVILWANLHLLFWLSLIPFCTGWMGENNFATLPVALYGEVLFMCSASYYILARTLISHHSKRSIISQAIGKDLKGIISIIVYALGIGMAFVDTKIAIGCYIVIAIMWFLPDRRIENSL